MCIGALANISWEGADRLYVANKPAKYSALTCPIKLLFYVWAEPDKEIIKKDQKPLRVVSAMAFTMQ